MIVNEEAVKKILEEVKPAKLVAATKYVDVKEIEKLEKLGFNLPFIVKLSHNLMLYDLLDKVYFDSGEVMDKLWP